MSIVDFTQFISYLILQINTLQARIKATLTKIHILTRTALEAEAPDRLRMANIALMVLVKDVLVNAVFYHKKLLLEFDLLKSGIDRIWTVTV